MKRHKLWNRFSDSPDLLQKKHYSLVAPVAKLLLCFQCMTVQTVLAFAELRFSLTACISCSSCHFHWGFGHLSTALQVYNVKTEQRVAVQCNEKCRAHILLPLQPHTPYKPLDWKPVGSMNLPWLSKSSVYPLSLLRQPSLQPCFCGPKDCSLSAGCPPK